MMLPATVILLSILATVVHSDASAGCYVNGLYDAKCGRHLVCEKPKDNFDCDQTNGPFKLQSYFSNAWKDVEDKNKLQCVGRSLDLKTIDGQVITHSSPRLLQCSIIRGCAPEKFYTNDAEFQTGCDANKEECVQPIFENGMLKCNDEYLLQVKDTSSGNSWVDENQSAACDPDRGLVKSDGKFKPMEEMRCIRMRVSKFYDSECDATLVCDKPTQSCKPMKCGDSTFTLEMKTIDKGWKKIISATCNSYKFDVTLEVAATKQDKYRCSRKKCSMCEKPCDSCTTQVDTDGCLEYTPVAGITVKDKSGKEISVKVTCKEKTGLVSTWKNQDGSKEFKVEGTPPADKLCTAHNTLTPHTCPTGDENVCDKITPKDDSSVKCPNRAKLVHIDSSSSAETEYDGTVKCELSTGNWKVEAGGAKHPVAAGDSFYCKYPSCTKETPLKSDCSLVDLSMAHTCKPVATLHDTTSTCDPNGQLVYQPPAPAAEMTGELHCVKGEWKMKDGSGDNTVPSGGTLFCRFAECKLTDLCNGPICPTLEGAPRNKYRCPAGHTVEWTPSDPSPKCQQGKWVTEGGGLIAAGTTVTCQPITTTTEEATEAPTEPPTEAPTEAPTEETTEEPTTQPTTAAVTDAVPEATTTRATPSKAPASASTGLFIALGLGVPIGLFLIVCCAIGLMGKGWLPVILMNKMKGGKGKKGGKGAKGKSDSKSKEGQSPGVSSKSPAVKGSSREGGEPEAPTFTGVGEGFTAEPEGDSKKSQKTTEHKA